ncbi:MAG: hypothetical protein HWN67_22635 [Candidatus Helarchaeota archaeon]|nr:hypothetical protein [Candidatus Helarchaeota archaeon]
MIKKSASIVIDNVSNLMDKQISDFNLASESFKSYFSKIMNKEISSSEESLTNLLNHINNTFQENLQNTKNTFNDLDLEIPKIFDNSKLEHNRINDALGKDVTELVNTYFLDWRIHIDKIRNDLEFVTKHIEKAEKNSRKFQSSIRESFSSQIDKFDLSLKDFQDRINTTTENNIQNLKTFLNSLKIGKEKATTNLIAQIKNSVNSNKSSYSNSFELILEDLKRNLTLNQDTLSTTITNNSRMLKKQLDIQQEKLSQSLNELKSLLTTNFLEKSKEELENLSQTLLPNLKNKIDPIKDKISNTFNHNKDNFETFLSNLKKNFQKISDQILKDYEFKIQTITESIDSGILSQFEDRRDIVSKIVENTKNLLNREAEKSQLLMENLNESFENNTANQLSNILKLLNVLDSKLMESLEQFPGKKIEPLSKIVEKIQKNLHDLNDENQTTLNILRTVLDEIDEGTYIDIEKTWSITSSESILDHVIDMISRIKRSITVILPNLSLVDLEFLNDFDQRIIMHIFTNVNLKQDNQILNELLSRGNIRIWNINGNYPLFCAVKDTEEMILAPYTENEKEIVGIVTEQKEYINIFRTILGPFFQTVSNEVKKVGKGPKATIVV